VGNGKVLASSLAGVEIREDNILLVNGKPFFPIGLYRLPPFTFSELNQAGFNTVRYPVFEQSLNEANRYNIKLIGGVFYPPPKDLAGDEWELLHRGTGLSAKDRDSYREKIYRQRLKVENHPALLVRYIADEPAWTGQPLKPLLEAYRLTRKLDPYHPIWMNHAIKNTVKTLAEYNEACDITSVDVYPVPTLGYLLRDRGISWVGKYTVRMRRTVDDRKPVWMILQGFSPANLSGSSTVLEAVPSFAQSRFMAYDAIVHGATGLIWWGTHSIPEGSESRDMLRKIASELRDISTILVSPTTNPATVEIEPEEDIAFLEKEYKGESYLFCVNTGKKRLSVRFKTPFKNRTIKVLFEKRQLLSRNGLFVDSFKANDVHIYTTADVLPPPLVPIVSSSEGGEKVYTELPYEKIGKEWVNYKWKAGWMWLCPKEDFA